MQHSDSYRRVVLSIRLAVGIITCLLSFVDINQGNQFLDTIDKNDTKFSFKLSGAAVWSLASHSLLYVALPYCSCLRYNTMFNGCIHSIPIFSIIIVCEQLAEFVRCSFFREDTYSLVDLLRL